MNKLLSSPANFQHYYSIVDRDIDRALAPPDPIANSRLFQLPVYHVENFLLDDNLILLAIKELLGSSCPFAAANDVEAELKQIVVSPAHIKPYAKAIHDARLAKVAKDASDAVFQRSTPQVVIPIFSETETDAAAAMQQAIADGSWRAKCKGRDVLKGFCGIHGLNYEHFRNLIISKLAEPPRELQNIMNQILR